MRSGSGYPVTGKADGRTHIKKAQQGYRTSNGAFQAKPIIGSTQSFRMRVPLPYCNSGIGYFVLSRPYIADIALCRTSMYITMQHPPRFLPDYRLLYVFSVKIKSAKIESA